MIPMPMSINRVTDRTWAKRLEGFTYLFLGNGYAGIDQQEAVWARQHTYVAAGSLE
jgi:hypothetical protein